MNQLEQLLPEDRGDRCTGCKYWDECTMLTKGRSTADLERSAAEVKAIIDEVYRETEARSIELNAQAELRAQASVRKNRLRRDWEKLIEEENHRQQTLERWRKSRLAPFLQAVGLLRDAA